jgi:DNA polymerase-3 subunit delta
MHFTALARHLEKGELEPVYLIFGPEDFLRGEAVRMIREKAARAKEPCDTAELDAAEGDPRKLLDELRTPSLFAPRRLVLIENAALLFDRAFEPLLNYVAQPSPRTTLVLIAGEKRPSARKPPKKPRKEPAKSDEAADRRPAHTREQLLHRITPVECPVVPQKMLARWCVERARVLGKPMASAAAELLADMIGANLGEVEGQIRNLITYCKDRPQITEKDVSDLCSADRLWATWELSEAILDRRTPAALRALDRILRDGERPGRILSAIARDLRRLIVIKQLARQRLDHADIAQRSRTQPWLVPQLLDKYQDRTVAELKLMLHQVLEADLACKTGSARDDWILERLTLKLCREQIRGD